jgi:hypothetical protein
MTMQSTITREPEADLDQLLDTIEELGALATGGRFSEQALTVLARRCRSVLGAAAVFVAVRRSGSLTVMSDADPDLDPAELARQVVLAEASLDDPVIDGRPGLPPHAGEPGTVIGAGHRHLRRLVTELPRAGGVRGTLTVCRRPPFATDEVDLAMAFAGLAELVVVQSPTPDLAVPPGGSEVVERLFAVGLALHLALRATEDRTLRHVVEDAIDGLDQAVLDIRRSTLASRPPT